MQIWFREPSALDESPYRRGEDPAAYLARSTKHRARETRRFLNENISMLPEDAQKGTYDALCTRYVSAFFELIVGRTLQILGATIEVEKPLASGRRPDFHAHFPNATIIVEAVSPNFDAPFGDEFKLRNPLTEIIERLVPDDWCVGISQLPNIGPNDSKREFRAKIEAIMSTLPTAARGRVLTIHDELPSGQIRFTLKPRNAGWPPIMRETSSAHFSNFDQILEQKFREKRTQVKGATFPALLAVEIQSGDADEDIDSALYGRTTESRDSSGTVISLFREGGLFGGNSTSAPTFAGLLAYRVGYTSVDGPVLYYHPRFNDRLPEALSKLACRKCVDGLNIDSQPASETWANELSNSLRFAVDE